MRHRSPEESGVFERREASRASERAVLAAKPHNPWLERDRYKLEAQAETMPMAAPPSIKQRRGRGRPPKNLST